jgi:1-pyrroline-5-carboxylate dehydrogenase
MNFAFSGMKEPANEPIYHYLKGSPERAKLDLAIKKYLDMTEPLVLYPIINGKKIETGQFGESRRPGNWSKVLAKFHLCNENHIKEAIEAALKAKESWASLPPFFRAQIFWRAAEILRERRYEIVAAAMLEVDKTAFEADADLAELIDFFDFNPYWALTKIHPEQPLGIKGETNTCMWRPLRGYVTAISPWNFPLAIGGNLPTSPAIMGNVVLWKPSSDAVLTAHLIMDSLLKAGLPDGVINLIFGKGGAVGNALIKDPRLGGIHFTGSLGVGRDLAKASGENTSKGFPKIVAECGGKDFIFAHESANLDSLAWAIVAAGYGFQGQKCSACSRVYVPKKIWTSLKEKLLERLKNLKVGDITDPEVGMGAVINKGSWEDIKGYIDFAKNSPDCEIIFGGNYKDSPGWFIDPTLVVTKNPRNKLMLEEIFGPVVTLYVYEDNKFKETAQEILTCCDFALTGSIYSEDINAINEVMPILVQAAGNLYVNDKCSGANVGRQWFGGDGASGTNNKAGSYLNLMVWISPSVVKWHNIRKI